MDPVTGLSLGRIVIGIGAFFAPELTARIFGLSPETNAHLPYMSRMFGAREIAVGAITLTATGEARTRLAMVGVAIDAADATNGLLELKSKRVPVLAGGMLAVVASGAVASGVLALVKNRD
ncbi:DUF4267 domain-containing protein [Nocardioides montaniterrae]